MTANLQRLLKDERIAAVAAIVRTPNDGSDHWDVVGQNLLIHCVTKNSRTVLWPHFSPVTRLGRGMFMIPDVGTEVLIGFDDGEFEGDPYLIGFFGRFTGSVALIENQTLILDAAIEARSVDGVAQAVATKDDLTTLLNAISGAAVLAGDGGAAFKANILAALTTWPTCTTVFKAE